MLQTKNIIKLIALVLLLSCIKPYEPDIKANAENKYVISGRVTDNEGWQEVDVSLTSPIYTPMFKPVSGCQIDIYDDKGNDFSLEEFEEGSYRVWMDQQYLTTGSSYKVKVITPDQQELVSGYDTMPSGPQLDSVYYRIEDIPTSDPETNDRVMQFYVDLNAQSDDSPYYKWEVIETWEHKSQHAKEFYYDGFFHQIDPPDSSTYDCWATVFVRNVFTLSTTNLSQNTYQQYPLHHIDGHTSRLSVLYSILVRQLALSEYAYNYWEQLRINSNEQGGLYEKQPLAIVGNLVNLTHPDKKVLGYFYAASESIRRYFYKDIAGIDIDFDSYCRPEPLGRKGWKEFTAYDYPVYYYYGSNGLRILNYECVDCRLLGGTTTKPDYWP